ncbi:hypothetical protein ABZV34_15970 [Streptomyces sp. NPDC005195]|uniref:hypothetical protein n=1 Tax=Streptomyces sp. NPDC005195 TaxID=3154561 RepID=UPI00339DE844
MLRAAADQYALLTPCAADLTGAVTAFDELERAVHLGPREDDLDPRQVVALACEPLDWSHSTDAVLPSTCGDPAMALAGLTAMIQESLLERAWVVWPVCPRHDLGVHGSEHGGGAVRWCAGAGGHLLAPVGELPRVIVGLRQVCLVVLYGGMLVVRTHMK